MIKLTAVVLIVVALVVLVSGHGKLTDPINRSSLWRVDSLVPANYDDNQLFCGGVGTHYGRNKGKCGICGDAYHLPHPQPNENTGSFGTGQIVDAYPSGEVIEVESIITANHLGDIQFHVCKIHNSSKPESGEECFLPLAFEDGSTKFMIGVNHRVVKSKLRLPMGLRCKHCALRWTYTAGNSWGYCRDGTGRLGCGPQETFRSCSDIAIV